ncbi:MAG TPA: pyridoxamine 5'-phosphate oxidase family protein [Acidimicrobiia bacterium]|nr:pyridoxamine 5'-phosphate oxidase family protein [Acidimicrobiia bacterium]
MDVPHLERLSAAECRRLLPGAPVGRLVVPGPTFPSVEPVSFAVVEGEVVVAVRAGSAGDAVAAGTVVAFEADVLDRRLRQGWSVAVNGAVEDLDADVAELVRPLVSPWPAGAGDRLILVRSERVSGRRIVNAPEPAADEPVSPGGAVAAAVGGDRPVLTRRELTSDAALDVLRRGDQAVGRLAVSLGGEPLIFPLNFAVDGDAVVFRTEVGTKLSAIPRSLVTFEVDHLDNSGQGWAVTFEGLAQEVLDSDPASLLARIDALALDTWPGGDRPHVVRITPYAVRGTAWTPAPVTAVGGGRSGAA